MSKPRPKIVKALRVSAPCQPALPPPPTGTPGGGAGVSPSAPLRAVRAAYHALMHETDRTFASIPKISDCRRIAHSKIAFPIAPALPQRRRAKSDIGSSIHGPAFVPLVLLVSADGRV
eukprot:COSAG06_NODE_2029_length_7797_cov_803.230969_6_plen_118_part_00